MSGARLLLLGLASMALVSCGGKSERERIAEIDREIDEQLAEVGPIGPGRGEAGPPPSLRAGWRTDFSRHSVPLSEFQSGGPGKDGIPAVDRPRFVPAERVSYLAEHEPVVQLVVSGEARAYPIQILTWHEIVNDTVAGLPVAVTFCPLCNTAIVFDRRVEGSTLDFGTTGNLRFSDLVMYDRQTESWWQQFGGEAVVGAYTGTTLRSVPSRLVAWGDFRRDHPLGLVLTRQTGFDRDYGKNPYPGYDDIRSGPFFDVANEDDDRLPAKERVVFVERGETAVAVPFSVLAERRRIEVEGLTVRVVGEASSALDDIVIADSRRLPTVEVRDEAGKAVPFTEPFWFVVAAFRPDVIIAP